MVNREILLEKRNQARNRITQASAIAEYKRNQIEQEQQTVQQMVQNKPYESNANFFKRASMTILDVASNILQGAGKSLEGIMDLGAEAVGLVGGIFDKDFQDSVKDFVATDYTSKWYTPVQNFTQDSYTNDFKIFDLDIGNFIEETASGVGQMLPSVATNLLIPGSGLAPLVASATGNATEEAFNDGASYNRGMLYGVASGAVEGLTEHLFDGVGGLYGDGLLDKYTNKVAKQGIARIAKNAVEEGVEEVVSELANPLTSMIYKGTDSLKDYTQKDYWKGVGKAGALGATTALAYNGTIGNIINHASGQNADIDASIESINNINNATQKLFAENKLTTDKYGKITADVAQNYKNIENVLQKNKPEKRADLIKKYQLSDKFDETGTIKAEFAREIGLNENNTDLNDGAENVSKEKVASYDKRYYNPRLNGKEIEIQTDLEKISADFSNKIGKTQNIDVYNGELTDTEQSAYTKVKKAINNLNNKGGNKLNIVLVSPNEAFNGVIKGNKIYINKDNLENGKWAKTVIHEYTHFAEGSIEYKNLLSYLVENKENFDKSQNQVANKNYGFEIDEVNRIYNKLESDKQLTTDESIYLDKYLTEVTAHMTENMLGNEEFINKVVRNEDSIAEKFMNRVEDLLNMFKTIKSAGSVSEYRKLKKTQRLYLKAVEASGKKYINGKIVNRDKGEQKYSIKENEIDTKLQNEYDLDNGESKYGSTERITSDSSSRRYDGSNEWNRSREVARTLKGTRSKEEFRQKIKRIIENDTAYILKKNQKDFDLDLYLAEFNEPTDNSYVIENNLFINYKLTENQIGELLDSIKSYKEEDFSTKRAKMSKERIDNFIKNNPNALIMTIKIDDFLALTGDKLALRDIHREASNNLKDVVNEHDSIWLNIDFDTNTLNDTDHEGRHRVNTLKKNGYNYVDIFVLEKNGSKALDSIPSINVKLKGKDFTNEVTLRNIVRYNSLQYSDFNKFKYYENIDNNFEYSLKENQVSTTWGDGIKPTAESLKEYNLINPANDTRIKQLDNLFNEVVDFVKTQKFSMQNSVGIRLSLFDNLQAQTNKAYSKLVEINEALANTKEAYDKDNSINIKQRFITELGYNGVYIPENSKTSFKGVLFDENNKKPNLLDYSKDRAKARLDKAIELFGETKNPAKAGWLLADGRFIDYNRDSSSILNETNDDFDLDYQDHWQIEKVFNTRRGNDAIDAFMAEGNIRLMPEAGGIEIRNKPKQTQISSLEKYIDSVIDKKGVTIDFRKPNTTENVLPNYVYYDNSFSAKTILNDIDSFYDNGNIARVIDGRKYSLKEYDNNKSKSSKKHIKYLSYNNVGQEVVREIRSQLSKIYDGINDSIADGIAIVSGSNVYIVDSGKENGNIRFGIRHKLEISDSKLRAEYIRRTNNESIRKGYISDELSSKFGDRYDNDRTSNRRQEFGKELSVDKEQSQNNKGRVSSTDANRRELKYSLKGQIEKRIASKTKLKYYNKADAERVINEAIEMIGVDDKYATIKGSTKEEIIDKLWIGLNSKDEGYRGNASLEIADYLLDHAVMESMYEDEVIQVKLQQLDILREYTKSMDLSGIKDEIKFRDLKDAYLIWEITKNEKAKGEKGRTPDVVVQELNQRGFSFKETNEADCFNQIYDLHKDLIKDTKKQHKEYLNELASPEKRKELQQQIAKEIMQTYDKYGNKTNVANVIDKYKNKISELKTQLKDTIERNSVTNQVLYKVQKFKDMKAGRFINAIQYKPELFKQTIGKLGNIKFRGDLNKSGTRDIISNLNDWYSKDNPSIENYFNKEVSEMLSYISNGQGKLSTNELRIVGDIADYFNHFIENYNKIYREGKYIDAIPVANKYVEIINRNKKVKVGWLAKLSTSSYFKTFGDPLSIMKRMDNYKKNGFFTETFRELEQASVDAEILKLELFENAEEFLNKNKSFLKDIKNQTVTYNGVEIPKDVALSLYMTLQRNQAQAGLMLSGFKYENDKTTIRIDGLMNESATNEQIQQKSLEEADKLFSQFNEIDKEYVKIAEKSFNEDFKKIKRETDIKRQGYSNVLENGYYYPISRAFIAHNVDSSYIDEVNRASNASYNKDTVKGAKGELAIEPLQKVYERHTSSIARYANLAIPIDNYNRVFNLNVGNNLNKPTSVNTEIQNVWKEGNDYFKKLIKDIQGIKEADKTGLGVVNFLRSGYAKFQLGANPKVWLTQLSSYIASFNILSFNSLTKGLAVKVSGEDVDKYCKLAKVRNADNVVGKAQGVLDNVDRIGNILMKPIGKVDRLVIMKLFGACQVEIKTKMGLEIGTEENKIQAGKLLQNIILDTQQNSIATERSSAMRSDSEFMRSVTMFTADSMKNFGRWIDSVSEISIINAELKTDIDAETRTSLEQTLKVAKKEFIKSSTTMVAIASFMAVVAQAFKYIYNKKDKDEDIAKTMTVDAIGNLFGGLPLIKDVYSYFSDGYEVKNFVYSSVNDVLDGFKNVFDLCLQSMNGENISKQDIGSSLRKFIYSVGQIFGIPVRNMYNIFYGITSNISPSLGYKINDTFYNQNYRSDLKEAIEKGDENMIATIADLITGENIGKVKDKATRTELNRLICLGYDALPRSIADTISNDGESIKLSRKQRNEFEETYSEGLQAVSRMMKTSIYEKTTDEIKAKSVKFIYDYYYEQAKADLFGLEDSTKTMLFAEAIDIETLAIAVQTAKQFESTTDKNGNTIAGSRKTKVQEYVNSLQLKAVQKYMIMGYLGYTNKQGESQVKSYINSLDLTENQKEELLKMSGY